MFQQQLMISIDNKTLLASGEFEDSSPGQLLAEGTRLCRVIKRYAPPSLGSLMESDRKNAAPILPLVKETEWDFCLTGPLTKPFLPWFEMVTVAEFSVLREC